RSGVSPRTLGLGGSGASDWKYLSARRLALFVAASIEQGTRWVLLEHNGPSTWERAGSEVESFLDTLAAQGAFAGVAAEDSHFVIADERVNRPQTLAEGKFNLLFGFATSKPGEFDTWLVTHRAGPRRGRRVTGTPPPPSKRRVGGETEPSIRGGGGGGPGPAETHKSDPNPPPRGVSPETSPPAATSNRAV